MELRNTLAIIALIPLYGFGIGLHLDLIDTGEMYHIENLVKNAVLESQSNLLMSTAFMSGNGVETINHAYVGLGLGKVLVDPDEISGNGDEYFDNKIEECIFHSDDDIDQRVCLACKILKKEIEPCEDSIFLDFQDLVDGTLQDGPGSINEALEPFGITIKGIATFNSMPDDLVIWDPDVDHFSIDDNFENSPPTEDDDLENDDSPAMGDCIFCEGFHILIFPDDENEDNVPEPMDDSASGGTIVITFDEPKLFFSFDIVDIENDQNAVATAFGEAISDTECDVNTVIKQVPIPLVNNAEVQTVIVDAINVKCMTIKYRDSGGITNFDCRCVDKKFDHEDVIAVGVLDLEDGYIGSTKISIPFEEGADVFESMSVVVEFVDPVIDFQVLDHGASHNDIAAYLLANFDITLEVEGKDANDLDEATIYDTEVQGGADNDLDQPLFPEPDPIGKLIVMKENSQNQPNDSGSGGTIRYTSDKAMTYISMDVVDHEPGRFSEVRFYDQSDCSDEPVVVDILPTEGADCSNDCHWDTLEFDEAGEDVKCMEIVYHDSGGFTNFQKACPSPSEWFAP